ncbi:hypothetical protein, partial [Nonomuraea insulae]
RRSLPARLPRLPHARPFRPLSGHQHMSHDQPPNTISDQQWARLQENARKANPHLDRFSKLEAIKHRKQSAQQFKNRKWS